MSSTSSLPRFSTERPTLARSDIADDSDRRSSSPHVFMTAHVLVPQPTTPGGDQLEEVSVEQVLAQQRQQQQQQQQQAQKQSDAAAASNGDSATTTTTPTTTPLQQKPPCSYYWIDVEIQGDLAAALPRLFDQLLQHLSLSPFMQRHLRDPMQWQTPQVVPLHDAILVVMRVLGTGDAIRHAAALCLPHVVVTCTANHTTATALHGGGRSRSPSAPSPSPPPAPYSPTGRKKSASMLWLQTGTPRDSIVHLLAERELPEATLSGCVVLWLGFHTSRTQALASSLRTNIYALAELPVDYLTYDELSAGKDTLLRLAAVAEEQSEGIQAVVEGDAVTDGLTFDSSPALVGALNVVKQAAAATERMLTRLEKRLQDLEHAHDAVQQAKIDKRLQVLTILSALFLPLTLMAGIWGMNFSNMPELQRENAYYWALSSMALVALLLVVFFYRNGWLN